MNEEKNGGEKARAEAAIAEQDGAGSQSHKPSQIVDQAKQAVGQAATDASDLGKDAQARAASLVSDVKDRAASAASGTKEGIADRLDDMAKAVHRSGEQLEGHQDWIAHLIESGADELGTLASTLRTNDLQGLLGKLKDLAQRQPAVFVGVAMAAGFATVRLGRVAVSGASRADLPSAPEVSREPK